jgi:hypothetical protein
MRGPAPVARWRLLAPSALAVLVGACGGHFVPVGNGGVAFPPAGACNDVSISGALKVVGPAECAGEGRFMVPEGAAGAFWRRGTDPAWNGPELAPVATIDVEAREALATASASKELESASSQKGLETGSSRKGLETGSNQKGLETAASQRGLDTGSGQKGLETGASQRGLDTGSGEKGLETGANQRGLETGARAASKPVVSVTKAGKGQAKKDSSGEFVVTVTNQSDEVLPGVAVVDRVSHLLRVDAAGKAVELADHSTLVLFESEAPLRPGESLAFSMHVYAR